MLRILIVDDQKFIREAYRSFCDSAEDVTVAGEAANGKEALEFLENHEVDVVLTDISMPEMNGFELAEQIWKQSPDQKVIVMTQHADRQAVLRMLKAGVRGYMVKDSGPDEVLHAIRAVFSGGSYFSEDITEYLPDDFDR